MKRCAIMQPTYLPWAGYFNLIASVDEFVFLDDVQFDRRSWQMRNRILLNGKERMLSVSTMKTDRSARMTQINLANDLNWASEHINLIENAYRKAPFFADLKVILALLAENQATQLVDLNMAFIQLISDQLDLKANFVRASQLACEGKRANHLGEICRVVNANEYLSPNGSKDYLMEDNFSGNYPEIELKFQNYQPSEYSQLSNEFISHLSIVDVVANIGWQATKGYIQS